MSSLTRPDDWPVVTRQRALALTVPSKLHPQEQQPELLEKHITRTHASDSPTSGAFRSICSFLLQTKYFTKWAFKLTGCVRLGGRVTPHKRRQAMSRMSPGLFLQNLKDMHFIKTFSRRTVRKVAQQQLCSGLPGSGDKIHIRLKRFNFTNVTTCQRTSSPRYQVEKMYFLFIKIDLKWEKHYRYGSCWCFLFPQQLFEHTIYNYFHF